MIYPRKTILVIGMLLLVVLSIDVAAQRKPKKKPAPAKPQSELAKLREEYVKATNDYKTSLQK
jgi:hypothetical protein